MKHRSRGFTLIEVLVATTLLTIVMGAVYTLFYSTIRSWRHVERGFNVHEEGREAVALLRRELNNLLSEAAHLDEGERNELTMFLVSEPLNVDKAEGRHLMRVRYRYNRTRRALVREEAIVETALPPIPVDRTRGPDRTRIKVRDESTFTVANNVRSFSLRYVWMPLSEQARNLELPPERINPVFVERHRGTWNLGLPQAVEVTLTLFDPEDDRREFVVKSTIPLRAKQMRWTERQLRDEMGRAA